VLGQLKQAGCPVCLDLVLQAGKDRDFGKLREDQRLQALTAGVVVKEPDYREAAKRFYNEVRTGKHTMLLATIKSGRMFTHRETAVNQEINSEFIYSEKAASEFALGGDTYPFKKADCEKRCCSVEVEDDGSLSGPASSVYNLESVCFWPQTPEIAVPISLEGHISQPEG